jgi:hypothetical protein
MTPYFVNLQNNNYVLLPPMKEKTHAGKHNLQDTEDSKVPTHDIYTTPMIQKSKIIKLSLHNPK